ncbi:MAG: SIS domain-containing protein [Clostridia bacterium]|nr:SIS domain-containing protein [Clostridia bacterium]
MKTAEEIIIELFDRFPELEICRADINAAFKLLCDCAESGALIMACGNGGSAADCEHIVGELMKGFKLTRPLTRYEKECFSDVEGGEAMAQKLQRGIKAVSLVSQAGLISAFANDVDASLVFAQQVFAYASNEKDVLIALSTSGNSENVLCAVKTAAAAGIKSVAVTGQTGGKLREYATVTIKLPAIEPYEVQEYTLPVYHALCAALEAQIFSGE